jgi:transcriptional regulator with XRE-family HTH domain
MKMRVLIDSQHKNIIGPHLKSARINSKYTQQELSNKLEVMAVYIDRASISKIECQRRIVTDYELVALAKVLNVSTNWLLEHTHNNNHIR